MFQTFLLLLFLVLGCCLALMTLVVLLDWTINLKVNSGAPGGVDLRMPKVPWGYYALTTALILTAFVFLLRRLVAAWTRRSRHAEVDAAGR
jgi:hypothetical protein